MPALINILPVPVKMPTEKSKEKSSDSDEPIAGYTDWNQVDIKFKNPDFQASCGLLQVFRDQYFKESLFHSSIHL